ncbi:DNA-binding protein [bacterium]|nr:DNA-binding protein [bacterium]
MPRTRSCALALALLLSFTQAAFQARPAHAQGGNKSGEILETLDVDAYTYFRVSDGDGDTWVAAPKSSIPVGARIAYSTGMPMQDFRSQTLERTFPLIYFVGGVEVLDGAETPAAAPSSPHNQKVAPAAFEEGEAIEPPAGGFSVADLFELKDMLAGKSVACRGRVVKYNANIMGMNWLHIQDGSGAAEAGNHDITVTTTSTARKGDIVLIEGMLLKDKNLGSGYFFPVIVEEATVTVE